MKKIIAILLITVISVSVFLVPVSASNGKEYNVPDIVSVFEKTWGIIVHLFSDCVNIFKGTDESNIETASEYNFSWICYDGEGFLFEPEKQLDAETWCTVELEYISDKAYADPFNDVDVDLLLYGDGKLYKIPGFWDGGNSWKIRFVCPTEGEWLFKTVCTDAENSSLNNKTGKIICREYSGEYDIYKHGFVTTASREKYFTYADGTPFFYLGDTHWSLGEETLDMVKIICEKRESQGFTVIQSEPIGAKFDVTDGISEADMYGFADYDAKFSIIAEHGFVHTNAQFFFPYYMDVLIKNFGGYELRDGKYYVSEEAENYLEKLSRYWVARYSAYPVMWTLGQEVDNDFYWNDETHPEWNYINNPYKAVAEYIDKYDAYDHPITAHQENAGATACYGDGSDCTEKYRIYKEGSMPSAFRNVEAHDFYAAQYPTPKDKQSGFDIEKDYWYNSQGKLSINYEGHYCYLWTKNFGARMQGWNAFLNGMYGYGWGAHDTWSYLNTFDEDTDSSDGVDTITSEEKKNATWEDSLEYSSSYQMGYMRNFFESVQWYKLIPRFDNKSYFVPCHNVYYSYASNSDNSEIVIYFYSFTDTTVAQNINTKKYGGILSGTVGSLVPKTEYSLQWFDPVCGEFYEQTTFTSSCFGTYYLGERPADSDMVLLIRQNNY